MVVHTCCLLKGRYPLCNKSSFLGTTGNGIAQICDKCNKKRNFAISLFINLRNYKTWKWIPINQFSRSDLRLDSTYDCTFNVWYVCACLTECNSYRLGVLIISLWICMFIQWPLNWFVVLARGYHTSNTNVHLTPLQCPDGMYLSRITLLPIIVWMCWQGG